MADNPRDRLIKLRRLKELRLKAGTPEIAAEEPFMVEAREIASKPIIGPAEFAGREALRFAEGAADLPLGAVQLASEALGQTGMTKFMQEREARIEAGRAETGQTGFDVTRLAGNIGTAAAAGPAKIAKSFLGKLAQGGAVGAATGAATPVTEGDFVEEKIEQVGIGTILGVGFPAIGKVLSLGKDVVSKVINAFKPDKSASVEARELLKSVTGDVDKVLKELEKGGTVPEAIARSKEPGLAAVVKAVEGRTAAEGVKATIEQNAARVATLREVSGGTANESLEVTLKTATEARKAGTNDLFEAAKDAPEIVDMQSTIKTMKELIKADPANDVLKASLTKIIKKISPTQAIPDNAPLIILPSGVSQVAKIPPPVPKTARDLISAQKVLKDTIDETAPTTPNAGNRNFPALLAAKESLDKSLENGVPSFKIANQEFKRLSGPVDKARVGLALEKKLVSPLSTDIDSVIEQKALGFTSALRDEKKLIRDALKFNSGQELVGVFGKKGAAAIEDITTSLKENAEFVRLATRGRALATGAEKDLQNPQLINALNRYLMVINAVMRRTGTASQEHTLATAAEAALNPVAFSNLMKNATQKEVGQIKALIGRIGPMIGKLEPGKIIKTAAVVEATREI